MVTVLNKRANKLLEAIIQLPLRTQCLAVCPATEAVCGEGYGVVCNWQSGLGYLEYMEPTDLNILSSVVYTCLS